MEAPFKTFSHVRILALPIPPLSRHKANLPMVRPKNTAQGKIEGVHTCLNTPYPKNGMLHVRVATWLPIEHYQTMRSRMGYARQFKGSSNQNSIPFSLFLLVSYRLAFLLAGCFAYFVNPWLLTRAQQESNLQPLDSKSNTLSNWAMGAHSQWLHNNIPVKKTHLLFECEDAFFVV